MNSTPRLSTKTCLVFLFSCFLVLRLYVVFNQPIGFDEGLYSYLANLTRTQSPYLDFFTGKTPGIFYLGSLMQGFSQPIFALRASSVIFQFLTVISLYYLCRRLISQKTALLAVALFTFDPFLVLNSSYFITENFYAFFMVLSLIFYLSSKNFASGFLIGLSFLFKQNGAVLLLVFPLVEILSKKPFTQTIRRLLTLGLGFLAVLAPFLFWWLINLDLHQAFIFLVKANSWNVTQSLPDLLRNRRDVILGQMTFSMPLILLSILGALRCLRSRERDWLLIWFSCLFLFLFVIVKGYTYMFIPLYVPMSILAGISFGQILNSLSFKGFFLALFLGLARVGLFLGLPFFGYFAFLLSPSKILAVSIGLFVVHLATRRNSAHVLAAALFISSLTLFTVGEYNIIVKELHRGSALLHGQQSIARDISERTSSKELIFTTNPGLAVLANRDIVPIDATYSGANVTFYGLSNYLNHPAAKFDLQNVLEQNEVSYLVSSNRDDQIEAWVNYKDSLGDTFTLVKEVGPNQVYVRIK